jgi:hypothetical protein
MKLKISTPKRFKYQKYGWQATNNTRFLYKLLKLTLKITAQESMKTDIYPKKRIMNTIEIKNMNKYSINHTTKE